MQLNVQHVIMAMSLNLGSIILLLLLTISIEPSFRSVGALSLLGGHVPQSDQIAHFDAPSVLRRRRSLERRRSRRQSLNDTACPLADIVSILGPRSPVDFVAVFDRAINVGKHEFFYYDRPIVEAMLRYYATVDQRYVRTAAITFALSARVAFDGISNGVGLTKCQLFNDDDVGATSVWNSVVFDDSSPEQYGRNITAALGSVIDIMTAGRRIRPTSKQVRI